jgi:hypothetical protein
MSYPVTSNSEKAIKGLMNTNAKKQKPLVLNNKGNDKNKQVYPQRQVAEEINPFKQVNLPGKPPNPFNTVKRMAMPTISGPSRNPNQNATLINAVRKILMILMTWAALRASANYMSNIYVSDVLIEEKKTPSLTNFAAIFTFMNLVLNVITFLVCYVLSMGLGIEFDVADTAMDVGVYVLLMGVLTLMASLVVQNRQYFLYEDDGLRAFRGLSDIMLYQGVILALLPYNKMF